MLIPLKSFYDKKIASRISRSDICQGSAWRVSLQILNRVPLYIYDNDVESIWRPLSLVPVGGVLSEKINNGDVKLQVSEQKEHVAYEKLRKRLPTL